MRSEPATLVELLRLRATDKADVRAFTFLDDKGAESETLTYLDLDRKARAIAARLQQCGARGTPVLLLYPPSLEFVVAFFGCLYAGALAVPAYPPRPNQFGARLHAIQRDTNAAIALTTHATLLSRAGVAAAQSAELAGLQWIATDTIDIAESDQWLDPAVGSDSIAFLQYTSGSTVTPKGVMVTHGNLIYNERMIELAFEHTEQSVVLGWLPLYHDMGLIGNVLQPLYLGIPCILMSPIDFLLTPLRWLEAITRYRATTSGAPDFAYDLCVRRIAPEQRAALDLSTWDLAYCGAEPIRAQTVRTFAEAFGPCGFRPEAFYPCYGLAEATLFVSGGRKKILPVVRNIENGTTRQIVGCGEKKLDERILIVDPQTRLPCAPGVLGEIWVSGANVARGYWQRPEETAATFEAYLADTGEGPFLRTGDLAFFDGGELCVQGRIKDTIIIRGCNHYPQDIEKTVEECHAALRSRSNAAFSIDIEGQERLVVVQEILREYRNLDSECVARDIVQAVADRHGLQTHAVMLIKAGSIPRTSSGKIQRLTCRRQFLDGGLQLVGGLPGVVPPLQRPPFDQALEQ
jgi:acyl-CoA synthetase (AMP-forming)/AMP-acid ligase II